ncbi:substrate-binding periplasmic protein [Vibrio brasiliensis]|uniref:Putative amino acid ABC transporter, periplasmic amino acid-binding protein n=1 Tax=Vibrio brasiliensis LMG 20546 TaxID=945543 RepID=E8LVV2_9VIBR|nr:transporter substrate-binding domain-containing protein [Vibrio brasiliensis]EGA65208.1 putative amino acid ABC transporter, periplasmic amino acid-binding protein [Vibrio brasiliensis LMG 20546]MCG9647546.1 transporter substrate-binding domain-containing protein [Vibrio brasiliensis]MCG9726345.1 transporter substrate-binding domain-containing protein [Vibrio brasiliensis]
MVKFYLIAILLILSSSAGVAKTLKISQDLWPPYIMNSVQGSGIAHDIVVDALVYAGYDIEFSIKPWTRVLKETMAGENDVIVSLWKTEQRTKHFLYTDPYTHNSMIFISRQELKFEFDSFDSLKGMRVALINDYAYGNNLREYKGMIPVSTLDLPNSIRYLLADKADVLVVDEEVGRWTVQGMKIPAGKLYFSKTYFDSTPLHAAVRKSHPEAENIVSALNNYFKNHAQGKLQALKTLYGLDDK